MGGLMSYTAGVGGG